MKLQCYNVVAVAMLQYMTFVTGDSDDSESDLHWSDDRIL